MLDLGLSTLDRAAYERALVRDHTRYVRCSLMDLNHNHLMDLSWRALTGQVTVDGKAEDHTRTLQAVFEDRGATIGFDSGSPGDGVMTSDRMLRLYWETYVAEISRWVSCPIFTGPVTMFDRNGAEITLEAHSKETRLGGIWKTFTILKGTNKSTAIKTLLNNGGEAFVNLSSTSSTLKADVKPVQVEDTYWARARRIADSLNMQLYYDAWGWAKLRPESAASMFTFSDGDYGSILTEPRITYDEKEMRNVVKVVGKTPSSGSTPPSYTAILPDDHPLSPVKLGRMVNGTLVPYYKAEIITNEEYDTVAECTTAAKKSLTERSDGNLGVTLDSIIIPHLEPFDMVTAQTEKMNVDFSLRTFSIPLELTDETRMTVGYTAHQTPNVSLIRRRVA